MSKRRLLAGGGKIRNGNRINALSGYIKAAILDACAILCYHKGGANGRGLHGKRQGNDHHS